MVSGHTGNVVPRKGLRVRAPCPPLERPLENKGFRAVSDRSLIGLPILLVSQEVRRTFQIWL